MFYLESTVFILSTIAIFILSKLQVPNSVFQQITAFLLVLTLIFLTRTIFPHSELLRGKKLRLLLMFLTSSLVQFLVISSGGFYSPFLILLHLYTLGTSFLLNTHSSILFLIVAVIALAVNTFFNPQIFELFQNDPGPVILYLISFIVIVPLAHFLIYSYRLKDKLFKTIKEHAQVGAQREESILKSLQEIIIVTDKNLLTLSINTAAEKILHLSQANVVNTPLLEILPLINEENGSLTAYDLDLEQIFADKATRIIRGFSLKLPNESKKRPVVLQVRAVLNSQGEINQLVFILTDEALQGGINKHSDLIGAQQHYLNLLNDLKKTLALSRQNNLLLKTEITEKIAEDILLTFELEDHPVKEEAILQDVAFLAKQSIKKRQGLAQSLGVSLNLVIPPENIAEKAVMDLLETDFPAASLPGSAFSVILDRKWGQILLDKVIEIAIFLSAEKKGNLIQILPQSLKDKKVILDITFSHPPLSPADKEDLFKEYFGNLRDKTWLKMTSGLEGYMAKTIANRLGITLSVNNNNSPAQIALHLEF